MPDSFVFYRSFAAAFRCLSDPAERCTFYDYVVDYALDGIEPDATGMTAALFALVKPQIDANNRRRESGSLGGRHKKQSEANESKRKQSEANESKRKQSEANESKRKQTKANVNVNVNVNENVSANADIAPAGAGESVTAEAIYRAYPARGRKFFSDTLKAITAEARSYAEAHDVSFADALAYMLTQTQLFASIAGRSRYVSRSDQFFAQGDWRGDAEQWRAQFDDGDDEGEETPVDREEQARKWHEQWERDVAAAMGDTSSELPPETVAMFARMQAMQAEEEAQAAKNREEAAK